MIYQTPIESQKNASAVGDEHFPRMQAALSLAVCLPSPGRAVLEVAGEVDMATAPQLADALGHLARSGPGVIVVDLGGVEFLGSAGLLVLVNAHHEFSPAVALHIVASSRAVHRAFTATGLDAGLSLFRSHDEVIATD